MLRGILALPILAIASFTTAHAQTIPPQIILQKTSDAIEGGTNGKFRMALNYPVPVNENIVITFSYTSVPPAATQGIDFSMLGLSGVNSAIIPAGATETFLEVDAGNDGVIEGPEIVRIQLNTATSASQTYAIDPAHDSATVLIADGNAASSTPLQVITGTNGAEPSSQGTFTVKLAGVATSAWPVRVAFSLSGTAAGGMDYQLTDQLIIPPNTNSVQVPVIIIDDHVIEPTETIVFTILSGSAYDGGGNAFIFPPDPANNDISINLADNDNTPTNRVLSVTKTADATEPATNGAFSINLPADYRSSGNITLSYTVTGTATQGSDYTIGTVNLPAYRNSIQIPVTVINNTTIEPAEILIFTIQNGSLDGNGFAYTPNSLNSADTLNILDDDAPLPLRLLSFEGYLYDRNIKLQWETADEQNTGYFGIERSHDGSKFECAGKIQAWGWGSNQYTFTDPKQPQHTNFYRLHMVDKDGKGTYSPIISLNFNPEIRSTRVYPNPAKGSATLITENEVLSGTKAIITDASGRLCQTVPITGKAQIIPLKGYTAGVYFLRMENGETIKLILK